MTQVDFRQIASRYEKELRENCLPFWLEHSQDREFGGYFSCLDRDGGVYDTDKFVWLQGREVWMFAMLYNNVEKNPEWLACAVQGARLQLGLLLLAQPRGTAVGSAVQHFLQHLCLYGVRPACEGYRKRRVCADCT